ncbi:MAG TPA: DUF1761 domain-containing protein [Bacteroidetes bacterium]|nr:DUF1761 domain-containing protein [Bacteroidota bacterium]
MNFNWLAILVAALVPTIIGFVWYNPMVLGKAWMKASGMTEEKIKGGNMAVIFGVSFLFSFMIAMSLTESTVHQNNVPGVFMSGSGELPAAGTEEAVLIENFTTGKYSKLHRTFSHGAFHGAIVGIFFALPLLGIVALFERKSFKYIFINAGYWILTLALMGGIICSWM